MTHLLRAYWSSYRPHADLSAAYGVDEWRVRAWLTRPWRERAHLGLTREELRRLLALHGGVNAASRATGIPNATLSWTARKMGVTTAGRGGANNHQGNPRKDHRCQPR